MSNLPFNWPRPWAWVSSLLSFVCVLYCGLGYAQFAPTPSELEQRPVPSSSEPSSVPVVNTVPPTPQGLNIYVTDLAGLLNPSDRATLQQRLQALDEAGLAQIAVLILPDTDRDLSEFAPVIMNAWDIQHYKKKDGLLVLVNAARVRRNLSGNRIFVATGYALEEKLPDAVVGRVLDEKALPAFSQGDFSGGVRDATLTLAQILGGDEALRAQYQPPAEDYPPAWLVLMVIILFFMFWNRRRPGGWGGGFYGGGFPGGFGGGWGSGGGGFGGGFGGGGDSSGGGGSGR